MIFAGDIEKSGIIYNLMKDWVDVSSFREALVADDFGMASLPEELRRQRLAIPRSLVASSVTSAEQPEAVFVEE